MIPNPWLILAGIAFLAVSHGWAFIEGGKVKENQIKAEQLERTQEAIEHAEEQAVEDTKLVAEEVKVQEVIRIQYRYIREQVNANIDKNHNYAECGLDADGLRLFNSGSATQAATSRKPVD